MATIKSNMARLNDDSSFCDEEDYLAQLRRERHLFRWCLITYAAIPADAATAKAADLYGYQPPGTLNRGLILHDEAWHWAMLDMFGEQYWLNKPEYLTPSPRYIEESHVFTLSNSHSFS
ncbi:hypothetical protein H5A34_00800 [Pectobacterium brasiliense]|uniref:hypothetical protein n=1 Tax=Pectobacterium TaxID=122277 RepID=UPI0019694F79|nr:hypothetical protein [Pectobacterium brasiliense]MBN3067598.1 hypothetical protein [Pectobacterium brasiliense]MBN3244689.1 hypothetical protein [Pectobacterium brasiliense]